MGTQTANYDLYKPASGEQGWASLVNGNWDDIDSLLAAGTHENLRSDGYFQLAGAADIALTSSPTNWNPAELEPNTTLRITADAPRNIHAMQAPSDPEGVIKILANPGVNAITIKDNSGTGTAAGRFLLPDGDVVLATDQQVMFAYDATASKWRPIGGITAASGGSGGAPTDAAYLVAATTGVTGLSAEVLVGASPGGELDGAGSTHADPAVSSIHGPEGLTHHDETHPWDDDAIHTDITFEVPEPVGLEAVVGDTGAVYGNHEHLGPVLLDTLVDASTVFGPSDAADKTIVSYAFSANDLVQGMLFRASFAGILTNTSGSSRNIQMKIKLDAATVLTISLSIVTGNTDAPFVGDAEIKIREDGSSGFIYAWGRANGSDGGGTNWSPVSRAAVGTQTALNTTGARTLLLTSANSASVAGLTHQILDANLMFMGVAA